MSMTIEAVNSNYNYYRVPLFDAIRLEHRKSLVGPPSDSLSHRFVGYVTIRWLG